jgi:APA family basic amino acid/polyamine antiporter
MMWAIIICTILYVAIALVLTGMVSYKQLSVGDPLAFVFNKLNLKWMSGIIAVSAVVAMASVLLVFQMGQPRIWMSMSRDGLLPKAFSKIHPKFHTPSFATIVTGFVVAVPALFMNLTIVTDLCSIGTLFAFVLVCAGVLKLQNDPNMKRGKFKTPYLNSKYLTSILFIVALGCLYVFNKQGMVDFIKNTPKTNDATTIVTSMSATEIEAAKTLLLKTDSVHFVASKYDMQTYLSSLDEQVYAKTVVNLSISDSKKYESGFGLFKHKIPLWIFIFSCILIAYYSYTKNLSLIPVLGLVSCLYMMSEMGISNWIGFSIWLAVGLLIYFGYSRRNSKLNFEEAA